MSWKRNGTSNVGWRRSTLGSVSSSASSAPDGLLKMDPDAVSFSADGRKESELPVGSRVTVRAGTRPLKLAKVAGAPFWRLVREKFRLPDDYH